jgi:isopenicillin N synthase-like dioxygenase
MTLTATLPILDLSLLNGTDADVQRFRDELLKATHEVGFFYLVGHGIPDEDFDAMIDLAKRFFALPEADKLAIENTVSPHFRGYTRIGGELTLGQTDWREQIDIGAERPAIDPSTSGFEEDFWRLEGPNLWPSALPELRPATQAWMDRLSAISLRLLAAWAESLGSPPDIFEPAFAKNPSSLLKIVRYPGADDQSQGVGAHRDLGVLTLLYVEEGKDGLQVEKDGQWIDAPPIPRAFVVNIGELLESATDGYLKATLHRVVSPAGGTDRISIPFFYAPALDATIPTLELPTALAAEAAGVTRDPSNEIHPVYGRNWLKSRLRAHPNVVEAHYPHLL